MIAHNIIRVSRCSGNSKWNTWYKDMIGKEFEVGKPMTFNEFRIYQVANPFKYIHGILLQEDCEFIKSLRTD